MGGGGVTRFAQGLVEKQNPAAMMTFTIPEEVRLAAALVRPAGRAMQRGWHGSQLTPDFLWASYQVPSHSRS